MSGFSRAFSAALVLVSIVGCAKSRDTSPLASPPAKAYVAATSVGPAYAVAPTGALSRTLYKADSGLGYTVEIREAIVPPRRALAATSLQGGVVVESLTGSGIAAPAGARSAQSPAVSSFAAGAPLALNNASARPAELRLFVFAPSAASK